MTLIVMFLIRFLPQETNSGSSPQILWNAQECARLRHILGTFAIRLEEWCRPTARKSWWAGTGLNRRHQDFQSVSLYRDHFQYRRLSVAIRVVTAPSRRRTDRFRRILSDSSVR